MASSKFLFFASLSVLAAGVSWVTLAQTPSNSPFASKKPKAWEKVQTLPPTPSQAPPRQAAPQIRPQQIFQPQAQPIPQVTPSWAGQVQPRSPHVQPQPQPNWATQPVGTYSAPQAQQPIYQNPGNGRQNLRSSALRRSWANRLGFGNVQASVSGHVRNGVAVLERTDTDLGAEFRADIDIRGEVSTVTDGGLEYGAGLRVRAQRDRFRRGFGGRVGDCPADNPACASALVDGVVRGVKGHTGQFHTAGNGETRDGQIALEGAYLFLRSSYGDLVVGRDDGSAYLFSLGAPSLVAVNASNSPIDYTGLDSVKTYNDASGFAEKIAYTSPRLLGDNIGFGVQFGASYAPNARACGVDYCVRRNDANPLNPFAPEIEDVVELGVAFDRKFASGFSAELTGSYARGSESSGNAAFENLQTFGAGLELKYGDFVFGTSYLNSNNGFAGDGDYTAYDAGLTWKPSNWGFTASYGHARDDLAQLTSDQGVLAVSYDLGKFRLGTGVQYIRRSVPGVGVLAVERLHQEAGALFIEAGVTF